MSTFGPDYDEQRDGKRLSVQLNLVRDVMLAAAIRGEWLSVPQIVVRLQNMHHTIFPPQSVEADLRHLRKPEDVRRRKVEREGAKLNYSEYRIFAPVALPSAKRGQMQLLDVPQQDFREGVR